MAAKTPRSTEEQRILDVMLYNAALDGNDNKVQRLVDQGANRKYTDNNGETPLMAASRMGRVSTVKLLYYSDPGADIRKQNKNDGSNAAHLASKYGHLKVLEVLIHPDPLHIYSKDKAGRNSIHIAIQNGHVDVIKLLLVPLRKDLKTKNGDNYLHLACYWGQLEVIKLLLKHGLSLESPPNEEGKTPQDYLKEKHQCNYDVTKRRQECLKALKIVIRDTDDTGDHNTLESPVEITEGDESGADQTKEVPKVDVGVQFSYASRETDHLQGVTISRSKLFTVHGDQPQSLIWEGHGFELHLPENTCLPNEGCEIMVDAVVGGKFVFPKGVEPVSAIYIISVTSKHRKPSLLKIQHCVALDKASKHSRLNFYRASLKEPNPPYHFRCLKGGRFDIQNQFGEGNWSYQHSVRWPSVKNPLAVMTPVMIKKLTFRQLFSSFQR